MGNIYSEVGRSFKTKGKIDSDDHLEALTRAIDLFDATILSLTNAKSPKLKEVLRAKEQFLDIITDEHSNRASIRGLDQYFLQFAIAARLRR
jgi:hypothetical protein